ncbi:MAG: O-antigen ligase family protein [Chamaesiphon sp.]|nr:O-antigen ligase family protein [Chamaesiphon sp.]
MSQGSWQDLFTLPEPELQSIWLLFLVGIIILPYTTLGAIPVAVGLFLIVRLNISEIRTARLNKILAFLSLVIVLISFLSINYLESLVFTVNIFPFFVFFASYQYLFKHPDILRKLAWVIIIASIPIIIIGFGQLWGGWGIDLKAGSAQVVDLHKFGMPLGRMSSIFYHANALANYLQLVFALCMGLWLDTYGKSNRQEQLFKPKLYFLSCYFVITLLALVLTSARTGWIVTILSIVAMIIYQKWYLILGIISLLMSLIFGAAYAPDPARTGLRKIVPSYFWARINDQMYPNRPTADTRESIFQFAGQLILEKPWSGWGLQTFGNLYRAKTGLYINHPHNLLLSLSYGLGIPITVFLMLVMVYIFYVAIRGFHCLPDRWKSARTIIFSYIIAAIGAIVMNMTDITIFVLPLNVMFWSILMAIYAIGKISIQEHTNFSRN